MATALPSSVLVLLTDAPLVKGEGLGDGTAEPAGEPDAEFAGPEAPVPVAMTTEEAVVGKGAALVL